MINRILVAVDRFENNKFIFDTAVSLAQTNDAQMMLLQVMSETEANYPALLTYTYYPMVDNHEYETYQKQLENYRQWELNFLQDLTKKAIAEGVDTEYTQLTGNPGRVICELASDWSADLVLVGSRGLRGLKEKFLGSVSNYVTHHAPCSVLIVRSSTNYKSDKSSAKSDETNCEPELTSKGS